MAIPKIQLYTEGLSEKRPVKKPALVTHPLTLSARTKGELPEIGSLLLESKLSSYFDLRLSKEPVTLTERLAFLGEIERTTDFEAKKPIGKLRSNGSETDDFIPDDSALVYKSVVDLKEVGVGLTLEY